MRSIVWSDIDGSNSDEAPRRVALGADHRDLRLAEHLAGRRPPRSPDGDPERGADEPVAAAHRERRAQVGADPLDDAHRVVGVDDRVEDDPELIAPEARHGVARSQRAHQALPDGAEQPVADRVADALVDDLEAVEVQQDDRDRVGVVGVGRGQRMRDPVGQQLPVGETGRRVVERAALGRIEQPRIVEGDRRELGEARQGVRSRAGRTSDRASPTRARSPRPSSRRRSAERRGPTRVPRPRSRAHARRTSS